LARSSSFEDQQTVWTPKGNPSIAAQDRLEEMFPSKGGVISALFEVKENVDSLLTKTAFVEMQAFIDGVNDLNVFVGNSTKTLRFEDICTRIEDYCLNATSPLDFFLNEDGEKENEDGDNIFDLAEEDEDILAKVRTGKGGSAQGAGRIITIKTLFGGTTPTNVT